MVAKQASDPRATCRRRREPAHPEYRGDARASRPIEVEAAVTDMDTPSIPAFGDEDIERG